MRLASSNARAESGAWFALASTSASAMKRYSRVSRLSGVNCCQWGERSGRNGLGLSVKKRAVTRLVGLSESVSCSREMKRESEMRE